MSRLLALSAFLIVAALPAEAAVKTQAVRSVERGVAVWRGAKPKPAPQSLVAEPSRIDARVFIAHQVAWPSRGLRTQGFFNGDGLSAGGRLARRRYVQGFYADRTGCD